MDLPLTATLEVKYTVRKTVEIFDTIEIASEDYEYLLSPDRTPREREDKVSMIIKDYYDEEGESLEDPSSIRIKHFNVEMALGTQFKVLVNRLDEAEGNDKIRATFLLRSFLSRWAHEIADVTFKE